MVPFKETINTKQELIKACKKGFEDYSNHIISKNDFCMFFGFTHGKAITTFYEGNYEQLLLDGGFNSGSGAYFSAGINAWKNLRDGHHVFPPFVQNDPSPCFDNISSFQQIFYGAPGTGKSHTIKSEVDEKGLPCVRTTFHPDSDYSTFVGAYKPTSVEEATMTVIGTKAVPVENPDGSHRTEVKIVYEFVPQAFLQAYIGAWKYYAEAGADGTPQKQFLVIEEINRGNCAQIFGDLFQLLDRNELGFSDYPIHADNDMKKHLAKAFEGLAIDQADSINALYKGQDVVSRVLSGDILLFPNNLYIWATMNTSDQSLFPIDSAFKRRWDWQYMPISDSKKGWQIEVDSIHYDWWEFLQAINKKIDEVTHSEDKKLGYFFCKAKNKIIDAETFVGKVIFYLWNDVFKDIAEETGSLFNDTDPDSPLLSFNKFYTVVAGKTTVVTEKVSLFLSNLGVSPFEDSTLDEDDDDSDEANPGKETLVSIQIPGHPVIQAKDSSQFEAFVLALKTIGIENVIPILDSIKYKRYGCPVLSMEKYPELDKHEGFSYRQEGELFIIKGCKTYTYIRTLEEIESALNLGLTLVTK